MKTIALTAEDEKYLRQLLEPMAYLGRLVMDASPHRALADPARGIDPRRLMNLRDECAVAMVILDAINAAPEVIATGNSGVSEGTFSAQSYFKMSIEGAVETYRPYVPVERMCEIMLESLGRAVRRTIAWRCGGCQRVEDTQSPVLCPSCGSPEISTEILPQRPA